MTKDQKNEVIELLKGKFSQYNNFYVTDTESLTVAQVVKLRRACFDKQVEMKVAKNTLIRKALESLDGEKYTGVYDSLHKVTALMFSENPKEPALILSSFRKATNGERPELKAAFINGDVYTGDSSLKALTQIKTKNELIGEVIGLLQSPAKRVIAALLHHHEKQANGETVAEAPKAEATPKVEEAPKAEATSKVEEAPKAEATTPVAEAATPADTEIKTAATETNSKDVPAEEADTDSAEGAKTE
ncbi:MAG: 50S ribosomal protein L10 [Bacteroidota bacterium]